MARQNASSVLMRRPEKSTSASPGAFGTQAPPIKAGNLDLIEFERRRLFVLGRGFDAFHREPCDAPLLVAIENGLRSVDRVAQVGHYHLELAHFGVPQRERRQGTGCPH